MPHPFLAQLLISITYYLVSEFGNKNFFHKCTGLEFNIGVSEFFVVNGIRMSVRVCVTKQSDNSFSVY